MDRQACPVCASPSLTRLDEIAQAAIVDYYRQALDIDTSDLLDIRGAPIALLQRQNCELKWYDPPYSGDEAFYSGLQRHPWYYVSSAIL